MGDSRIDETHDGKISRVGLGILSDLSSFDHIRKSQLRPPPFLIRHSIPFEIHETPLFEELHCYSKKASAVVIIPLVYEFCRGPWLRNDSCEFTENTKAP